MTSTTGTAGHPEVEELSDLSEGVLPPSRSADVRRHLDDCALCRDVYASLEEIRGLLGTLPGPERMPDDVAGRIDAALAAEALLDATAPNATEGPSPATADADVSRETSPSSPTVRPPGHGRATTGPGRIKRSRRGRPRTVALAAVFTAAAVGLGTLLVQTLSDDSAKAPQATPQAHTDAAHTYAEGTLQSQVANMLAGRKKTGDGRSGSSKPWGLESDGGTTESSGMQPNTTLQGTTVSVPECIERAVPTNLVVLAADTGVFRGTAVYLVITPNSTDSDKVTAYIVDAACVKQVPVSPGKVLLSHSYTRS
ncbi:MULTISPECIES: anti-sigma factor family protein [unclassified Streptomyces]|uniref:anti-sigma factor family protein n=1 Tax=unclassified Streptomyces TaxID=2593676 RepID=UPI003D92DCC2